MGCHRLTFRYPHTYLIRQLKKKRINDYQNRSQVGISWKRVWWYSNKQGPRHVFGIGGTVTVGAQLETRSKTHLPRKFRFCSDIVLLFWKYWEKNKKMKKKKQTKMTQSGSRFHPLPFDCAGGGRYGKNSNGRNQLHFPCHQGGQRVARYMIPIFLFPWFCPTSQYW